MTRSLTVISVIALSSQAAIAQEAPTIPAPPPEAQGIRYVSVADANPQILPKGRSQTEGAAPQQRSSGYAGDRPAAYTRPIGQQVYTSRAYPAPAPSATVGATQGEPAQAGAMQTMRDNLKGVRVEARLGWDQSRNDGDVEGSSSDALLYGLGIGYDRPFGNMFVGGYAGIDWSDARTKNTILVAGTPTETHLVTVESGKDIELGIRAGYWIGEHANVYGFAAHTKQSFDITIDNQTNASTTSRSVEQDGWRVGAGSEYHLPSGFYGKAEYRYSDYGDDPAVTGNDRDKHQLVTGLGMRF